MLTGSSRGLPSNLVPRRQVFDLDFGRVGLATCFDMNFMEAWAELDRARVDVVFWPSAYGGGMPIRAYSALYRFAIVPAGWGDITLAGGIVAPDLKQEKPNLFTGKRHLCEGGALPVIMAITGPRETHDYLHNL